LYAFVCLTVAAGGGAVLAVDGDHAEDLGGLTLAIDPTGTNASNRSSLLNDATFGNFETPYDFFYQPWELPQIAFPQSKNLGNRHQGGEGDYKGILWSQVSNNGRSFGGVDVWSAAYLTHLGPGFFGVGLSFGNDESSTKGDTDSGTPEIEFGETSSFEQELSELYLTYGAASGTIHWGVGLTLFGYEEGFDTSVEPTTTSEEIELKNYNVKGGLKFKGRENLTWAVWGQFGQPEFDTEDITDPAFFSDTTSELDGDLMALGADLNLYRSSYDLEFDGFFGKTEYDVTQLADDPLDPGVQLVDEVSDGEVSDDVFFVRGRVCYSVGPAHIWHGLSIGSRSTDSDLVGPDLITADETQGRWEVDDVTFTPSTAVKFPLGCQECSTKLHLLAGARYEKQ
jgi:hypothetical protein